MFGRHEKRLTQQLRLQAAHRLLVDQPVAALGDHHRIDDEERHVEIANRRRDGFDDGRVGQHPGLDGIGADVGHDGLDLRGDEIGRDRFEHRDAECVLCGDGGDRGRAVHAVRGECLEVGLNACAGAGIASGDGQRGAHASSR